MSDDIRIGGATYGWGSAWVTINGIPFRGLNEIAWDEKLEVALGYSLGQNYAPQQRSAGKYTPTPTKWNILATAEDVFSQILLDALSAQGYPGSVSIGKAIVPLAWGYDEPQLGPVMIRAIGAKLISRGQTIKEAPEIFVKQAEFSVMRYVCNANGVITTLWDSDETGPV